MTQPAPATWVAAAALAAVVALGPTACGGGAKHAPAVTATIEGRDEVRLVAVGLGAVWIGTEGVVTRLDPRTGTSTFAEVPGLASLAVGDKAVWAGGRGGVSRLDPGSGRLVVTVPVGYPAGALVATRDSVWAVVNDNALARVGVANDRLLATVPVAQGLGGVAAGEGAVWTTHVGPGELIRVDPATNRVTGQEEVGVEPRAVAVGEGAVWVADTAQGTVLRYDPRSARVVATVEVPDRPRALAAGEGAIWVVGDDPRGLLSRIDPATNAITAQLKVGRSSSALTTGEGSVWVGRALPGAVLRVAATDAALLAAAPVPKVAPPALLEYHRSGGIAGLYDVLTVDLATGRARLGVGADEDSPGTFELPGETVAALRAAADDARFPSLRPLYRGSAHTDAIEVQVTYKGRTVRATGPTPDRLNRLVRMLATIVEERRRP